MYRHDVSIAELWLPRNTTIGSIIITRVITLHKSRWHLRGALLSKLHFVEFRRVIVRLIVIIVLLLKYDTGVLSWRRSQASFTLRLLSSINYVVLPTILVSLFLHFIHFNNMYN